GRLGEKERQAILVRYMERKSVTETSKILGVSVSAVEQRLQHGIEKIRRVFASKGFVVPAVAVGAVMMAESAKAAPAALTASAVGVTVQASASVVGIAKGALAMMKMAMAKTIAVVVLATGIVATIVTVPLLPKAQGEPVAASTPANPVTRVTGTVKDAETGKAIEKFHVMSGSPGSTNVTRHINHSDSKEFAGGKFEYELEHKRWLTVPLVCVEAEGYLPYLSEVIDKDEAKRELTVQLRKGKPIEGKVVDAAGKVMAGVSVILVTEYERVEIREGIIGKEVELPDGTIGNWNKWDRWTKSDEAGRFQLPPREWKVKVVATSDAGYAVVTGEELAKTGVVTVAQPWGRIEGVVMEGTKPLASVQIAIEDEMWAPREEANVGFCYAPVTTDAQGRFVFPRVHAFETFVSKLKKDSQYHKDAEVTYGRVKVEPGKTVQVRYGDKGRPVTGTVFIPVKGAKYGYAVWSSSMWWEGPATKLPEDWATMSANAKKTWYDKYGLEGKTPQERQENPLRGFDLVIDDAGKFRIPSMPPGLYRVNIRVLEKTQDGKVEGEEVAHGRDYVMVYEAAAGKSDEAQDLGQLRTETLTILRLGDLAPEMLFEKVDGSKGSLADYKGKIVVVDFCRPSVKSDMTALKESLAKFEKGGEATNFVMLALNVDRDQDAWQKDAETENLGWVRGNVGPWRESKVTAAWGAHPGMPTAFVVGRAGKIVWKGWPGLELKEAIEREAKR
ncbi:MAG: redoxin domain-containing protein, partial [Phycisphaerales bacterium]|nr:redoxin domain-containing protein [Phycisphaerales bacterium]